MCKRMTSRIYKSGLWRGKDGGEEKVDAACVANGAGIDNAIETQCSWVGTWDS